MTKMEGWKDTVGKRSSGLFICCLKQLVCACLFLLFCLICGFKYFGWSRKMDERRGDWGNPTSCFQSTAELALFHTGAISFSLICRRFGGNKCLFRTYVKALVCVRLLEQLFQTIRNGWPLLHLLFFNQWAIQRQILSSVFVFFDQFSSAASSECRRGLYSDSFTHLLIMKHLLLCV